MNQSVYNRNSPVSPIPVTVVLHFQQYTNPPRSESKRCRFPVQDIPAAIGCSVLFTESDLPGLNPICAVILLEQRITAVLVTEYYHYLYHKEYYGSYYHCSETVNYCVLSSQGGNGPPGHLISPAAEPKWQPPV